METEDRGERLAFEEFQLFYESTERVTERRLSGNRWNYSICSAVVVAVAVVLQWAIFHPNLFAAGVGTVIILCAMGALFCSLWIGQIRDFKKLNNAKFEVLNSMAPHISFGPSKEDDRISYLPFNKEWQVLQNTDAVQQMDQINIVALNSSNVEYLLPKAFRVVFLLIVLFTLIVLALNWDVFVTSLSLDVNVKV